MVIFNVADAPEPGVKTGSPNSIQTSIIISTLSTICFQVKQKKQAQNSTRLVLDDFWSQFSSISFFAFAPDTDMLHLSVPAFHLMLLVYITGYQVFSFFNPERRRKSQFLKSVAVPYCLPQATVKLSHFLKLRFHKSNHIRSEITTVTVATHCSLFSLSCFYLSP